MKYNDMPNNSTYDDDIIFSNHPNAREITLEECIEFSKKKKNDAYNKTGNPVYNSDEYIKISNMSPDEWISYCKEKKHKQDLDSLNDIGKAIPSPWNNADEYYKYLKNRETIARATGNTKLLKAIKDGKRYARNLLLKKLGRIAFREIRYFWSKALFIIIAYAIINSFISVIATIPLFIILLTVFIKDVLHTYFTSYDGTWDEIRSVF